MEMVQGEHSKTMNTQTYLRLCMPGTVTKVLLFDNILKLQGEKVMSSHGTERRQNQAEGSLWSLWVGSS